MNIYEVKISTVMYVQAHGLFDALKVAKRQIPDEFIDDDSEKERSIEECKKISNITEVDLMWRGVIPYCDTNNNDTVADILSKQK